jgi:hypothetical protein
LAAGVLAAFFALGLEDVLSRKAVHGGLWYQRRAEAGAILLRHRNRFTSAMKLVVTPFATGSSRVGWAPAPET